jgi:hypothetical protein
MTSSGLEPATFRLVLPPQPSTLPRAHAAPRYKHGILSAENADTILVGKPDETLPRTWLVGGGDIGCETVSVV